MASMLRVRGDAGRPGACHGDLAAIVAGHVVPRLAARHESRTHAAAGEAGERLARASLSDPALLWEAVDALRDSGMTLPAIVLDGLAPAARRLGDDWLADRLSFFEVSRGTAALQAVARRLCADLGGHPAARDPRRSILLATVPGEQHSFGVSIVAAFFRRSGWAVECLPGADAAALIARVRTGRFAFVGLSAAGDRFVAALPILIDALRRAAPGLAILVGGPAFLTARAVDGGVGADALACDAPGAVSAAERLIEARDGAARATTTRRPGRAEAQAA